MLFRSEKDRDPFSESKMTYAVHVQHIVMLGRVDGSDQAFDLSKIASATDGEEKHEGGRLIA